MTFSSRNTQEKYVLTVTSPMPSHHCNDMTNPPPLSTAPYMQLGKKFHPVSLDEHKMELFLPSLDELDLTKNDNGEEEEMNFTLTARPSSFDAGQFSVLRGMEKCNLQENNKAVPQMCLNDTFSISDDESMMEDDDLSSSGFPELQACSSCDVSSTESAKSLSNSFGMDYVPESVHLLPRIPSNINLEDSVFRFFDF